MNAKHSSCTSDTSLEPSKLEGGCPCGRVHPRRRKPRSRSPRRVRGHSELTDEVYQAVSDGKGHWSDLQGRWFLNYAGNCENPVSMIDHAREGHLFVRWYVRCRRCGPCRKAKMYYWVYAAMEQMRLASESGRRTWFGTLTLSSEWQERLLQSAMAKEMEYAVTSHVPEWWGDPHCDERFRLVRDELVSEVQRYWKRLRKAGHRFKYMLVFERHKSGLPHMHFLLHEEGDPILKRQLRAAWHLGFVQAKLVQHGSSESLTHARKAAFYVAKYLQKSDQSRQLASRNYRPGEKRSFSTDTTEGQREEFTTNVGGGPEGGVQRPCAINDRARRDLRDACGS